VFPIKFLVRNCKTISSNQISK